MYIQVQCLHTKYIIYFFVNKSQQYGIGTFPGIHISKNVIGSGKIYTLGFLEGKMERAVTDGFWVHGNISFMANGLS